MDTQDTATIVSSHPRHRIAERIRKLGTSKPSDGCPDDVAKDVEMACKLMAECFERGTFDDILENRQISYSVPSLDTGTASS